MSQLASSTVLSTLTDYARGIFPEIVAAQDPIIQWLAPFTQVASATGKYKEFSDKNAFQAVQTARAIGGTAKRLEFLASDRDYSCLPQALEIGIDDHERKAAGGLEALLESAKTKTLLTSAAVSHINDVVTALNAARSADATPAWSVPASGNPVSDLDTQIQNIADDIGQFPTHIVFGLTAWRWFRNSNAVLGRFPNAAAVNVSSDAAAGILLNPAIKVGVTTAIRDSNKPGTTKATANMLASNVWVFYSSPNPDQFDASFAKTFVTPGAGIDSVRKYRSESNRSDILALDWARDIRVTSTISARRLTPT